jgi:hypothetical protein
MKIIDFRYISKNDEYDDTYPHWSRKWEYPTVFSIIKSLEGEFNNNPKIHNSSCLDIGSTLHPWLGSDINIRGYYQQGSFHSNLTCTWGN